MCLLVCLAWAAPSEAGPYIFRTLAGIAGGPGGADGTGGAARFNNPHGVAVDGAGTIYVADTNNHTIRTISPAGIVSTLAGLAGSPGSTDGPVAQARFNLPLGIAVDAAGNIYVSDTQNSTIRKISTSGTVSTLAGLAGVQGPVDGTGSAARFSTPWGLAVDGAGTLYVADSGNHTIRKITPSGTVTTLAGLAFTPGTTDAAAAGDARFRLPRGVTLDGAGTIYVADTGNHTIRKIDLNASPTGTVSTLAGSPGNSGGVDGTGVNARFASPEGIVVGGGTIYVASFGAIRKVTTAGTVTTFVAPTHVDGSNGTPARFNTLSGIAVDADGRALVADSGNHAIRAVAPDGTITIVAGLGPGWGFGSADGAAATATFRSPKGVAVDAAGMVYVADSSNHTIRKITPSGMVSTLAGLAGSPGNSEGSGSAARFSTPTGVAVDTAGTVYVADSGNRAIRKITPAGIVSTLVTLDSTTTPEHIAVGVDGNVYVGGRTCCIVHSSVILRITPTGTVSTVLSATIENLQIGGLAVDAASTIYYTDIANCVVYKRTASGEGDKLGGRMAHCGHVDGPGSGVIVRWGSPSGITVDATGTAYVADSNTIRKIGPAPDYMVTTIGSVPLANAGAIDGIGGAARFSKPRGLAVDAGGRLYIADTGNHTIRTGATGRAFDYDADLRSELMVYRPANGNWYNSASSSNFTAGTETQFGLNGDVPVPGDYDGDSRYDLAVYRPATGTWFILQSATGTMTTVALPAFQSGDVPVPADFDGDGRTDPAIYRPATGVWSVLPSTTGQIFRIALGRASDIPAPGDYDGDGKADAAVYRPSTGNWLMRFSSTNRTTGFALQWGLSGDIPVPADYDGDGQTDLAVHRPANGEWYILTSSSGYTANVTLRWGLTGDTPVPSDYDGDGRADPAVYRPSIGSWYILQSSTDYTTSLFYSWGLDGDIPIPNVIVKNGMAVVASNPSISPVVNLSRTGDFDGDGRGDITVYRPSTGDWFTLRSATNYSTTHIYTWGLSGDVPVGGDYDGDGTTDVTFYRPSTGVWQSLMSSTNFTQGAPITWGAGDDVPVPGDYNGDGITDLAVYRPSTNQWFIRFPTSTITLNWGLSGDLPIPGDYDGDGLTDVAVYRPASGEWFILKAKSGFTVAVSYAWGLNGDVPVAGDYDGDGRSDLAVYRPADHGWYILKSSTGYSTSVVLFWGLDGDVPVPADFDGDGATDIAVYRPGASEWYILKSSTGNATYFALAWGLAGDIPIFERH